MQLLEDMADELALETLKRIDAGADDKIVAEVAQILGSSSQTLQEAFLTAVRVRRAEARAKQFFKDFDVKGAAAMTAKPGLDGDD
jgi:hypothetical protein